MGSPGHPVLGLVPGEQTAHRRSKNADGTPRAKARLVVRGFNDVDALNGNLDTASPTTSRLSRSMCLHICDGKLGPQMCQQPSCKDFHKNVNYGFVFLLKLYGFLVHPQKPACTSRSLSMDSWTHHVDGTWKPCEDMNALAGNDINLIPASSCSSTTPTSTLATCPQVGWPPHHPC